MNLTQIQSKIIFRKLFKSSKFLCKKIFPLENKITNGERNVSPVIAIAKFATLLKIANVNDFDN